MRTASSSPRVSVLMPSLNQREFIETAIRSVLVQSDVPLELLVCDGGSSDGTLAVLERLATEFAPRLVWISSRDTGPANAVNKALQAARGEIIGWLNADDIYAPEAIVTAVRTFEGTDSLVMVYGEAEHVDGSGRKLRRYPTRPPSAGMEAFQRGCYICQPTVFLKRNVFHELGGLDEKLSTAFDFDLWLRIFLRFPGRIGFVARVQAFSRLHESTITSLQRRAVAAEALQLLSKYLGNAEFHWLLTYVTEAAQAYPAYDGTLDFGGHISTMLSELRPCFEDRSLNQLRQLLASDRRLTLPPAGVHADMFPDGWAGRELALRIRSRLNGTFSLRLQCENVRPAGTPLELTIRTNRGNAMRLRVGPQTQFEVNVEFSNVGRDELLFGSVRSSSTFIPSACEPGSTDGRELAFRVLRIVLI